MRVKIVHPATTRRKKIKPDRRSTCRASADLRPQKNMRDVLRDARLRLRAHTHSLHLHTNSGNKATRKRNDFFLGFTCDFFGVYLHEPVFIIVKNLSGILV
jgi:hypothetical protein